MAKAVLVIPPFMKYSAGPLLGPALLQAKARSGGHRCSVLDLNAHFIRKYMPNRCVRRSMFVGDHDKPNGSGPKTLSDIESIFNQTLVESVGPVFCGKTVSNEEAVRRLKFCFLSNDEVKQAGENLCDSSFGMWTRSLLEGMDSNSPDLVGLSLLHAGQVVPAVATVMIARDIWPDASIIWGGPHISGISDAIKEEDIDRRFAADLFVTGHAEQTFSSFLDQISHTPRRVRPYGVVAGNRGNSVVPVFENLELYDDPPVLPAQSTLGCAFGRCTFCTYPVMEPKPKKLDLNLCIDSVTRAAESLGGTVSVKDSLVTPLRLREIGDTIDGRVKWSACTKLNEKIVLDLLKTLGEQGLTTLEVGLESLLVETQRRVAKVHPPHLFETFLETVAMVSNLTLVVNYMTGFPWEDEMISLQTRNKAAQMLDYHLGNRGTLECNQFELERMSPMALDPERYLIARDSLKFWPWASVVEYKRRR